jgi:1,2-diacylglycerol 3-alpha-glucosyltransferase
MTRIGILFHRFGPYHWARLNAAGRLLPALGLELSAATTEYGWGQVSGQSTFGRVTLFPESDGRGAETNELLRRVHNALDEYTPVAMAIPGWSDRAALAALSWCLKTGTPAIVMSDSQASDRARTWARETVKKRIVNMCSSGLVGGAPHAGYLAALGMPRDRIFAGYDVVDNDYFSTQSDDVRQDATGWRRRLKLPGKYFLACNRFIAKKNLAGLLRAYFAYRRRAGPKAWKLVLLGDGPLKPQLLAQIAQLGLAADVLLPGFKQYDQLPAYYALAGAFVHASVTEQWGLVVNEAMACRLPVLVSECCGCVPDLVSNGKNGFTFNPLDTPGLAQCLLRIAGGEHDLAALGGAGREIIAQWSPETFAVNLKQAAETAMAIPRRARNRFNPVLLNTLLRLKNS